jgi:hypothetical protein
MKLSHYQIQLSATWRPILRSQSTFQATQNSPAQNTQDQAQHITARHVSNDLTVREVGEIDVVICSLFLDHCQHQKMTALREDGLVSFLEEIEACLLKLLATSRRNTSGSLISCPITMLSRPACMRSDKNLFLQHRWDIEGNVTSGEVDTRHRHRSFVSVFANCSNSEDNVVPG